MSKCAHPRLECNVSMVAVRAGVLTVDLDSDEGRSIRKALAAEQRVKLLMLLGERAMNVNDIAAALSISQPNASVHIRVLEDAGLVESTCVSTPRGSEKRCWAAFKRLVFERTTDSAALEDQVEEISMPIGLFTAVSVSSPCGLADEKKHIGFRDDPQSFLVADRAQAQILWFSSGWVEYTFPCHLPADAVATEIEFEAEMCSEVKTHNNDWPSDISVWINGVDVGKWTSPGDFGGTRGRLNPEWWPRVDTQFGLLKTWSINESGSRVDGASVGEASLKDLNISHQQPISIRIGIKDDAQHIGGVNLFGKSFGNYPQDLILRIRYKL